MDAARFEDSRCVPARPQGYPTPVADRQTSAARVDCHCGHRDGNLDLGRRSTKPVDGAPDSAATPVTKSRRDVDHGSVEMSDRPHRAVSLHAGHPAVCPASQKAAVRIGGHR